MNAYSDDDGDDEQNDESIDDVMNAVESAGFTDSDGDDGEAEAETEDGPSLPGPLKVLEDLQGSGKSLESYQDSAIASAIGPEDSKGALHIARGVDGLSPIGAAHPLMDIGIGFLILKAEAADDGAKASGDTADKTEAAGDDGDDGHYRGDMLS